MALNYRLLPRVARNTPERAVSIMAIPCCDHLPVVLHNIALPQFTQEVLIVRDDDELEVRVALALVDDTA